VQLLPYDCFLRECNESTPLGGRRQGSTLRGPGSRVGFAYCDFTCNTETEIPIDFANRQDIKQITRSQT